jgi:hypothetical protein
MCVARRRERRLDADVQLLGPETEPDAASCLQRHGFGHLDQAEQATLEETRLCLATGRSGKLNMVEAEHAHASYCIPAAPRSSELPGTSGSLPV